MMANPFFLSLARRAFWPLGLALIGLSVPAMGQGCSDAGFCSVSAFRSWEGPDLPHLVRIGASYGLADYEIGVLTGYAEFQRRWNDRWATDIRLTHVTQSGLGVTSSGWGDVYLTGHYALSPRTRITAGIKWPLADGNRQKDGLPLPMDLQPGLGTVDVIAGAGFPVWKLQVYAAIQLPLTQNDNAFDPGLYPEDSPMREVASTRGFERKGDVMVRITYPIILSDRWTLTPGVLPIFHLGEDRYLDANGIRQPLEGSGGLTVNLQAFADYALTDKSFLQIQAGMPLVVREARPDGLTRAVVAVLEWRRHF